MDVAIVTVGDELLAGESKDTNGPWLARRLTEQGVSVRRSLSLPDDRGIIAEYVRSWSEQFDAVILTGGLGGTPDDITMDAVADGFDRDLIVDPTARAHIEEKARAFREENPDVAASHDFDVDYDAWASIPERARPLRNNPGWATGCVIENVYVFPGVPEEMRSMFEQVADEFGGDVTSETVFTSEPEGALTDRLTAVGRRFDVTVGSYPTPRGTPGRVKLTGTNPEEVTAAARWLSERVELADTSPPHEAAEDK